MRDDEEEKKKQLDITYNGIRKPIQTNVRIGEKIKTSTYISRSGQTLYNSYTNRKKNPPNNQIYTYIRMRPR